MNSSGICTQQRDKEAKAFRSFLRVCLICSAGLHGVVLGWLVSHPGGVPLSQTQPIEIAVMPVPESPSKPTQAEPGIGKPSLTEPGEIEYLPFGDSGVTVSSLGQTADPSSTAEAASSTGTLTEQKGTEGQAAFLPAPQIEADKIDHSNASDAASATPQTTASSELPTSEPPGEKPQSPLPSFSSVPALTAAIGSGSSVESEQQTQDQARSSLESAFTAVPALNAASNFNQPTASLNPDPAAGSSPEKQPDSNPNDWAANLRKGIATLFSGSTSGNLGSANGNSGTARKGGQAGAPSGNVGSPGVAVRSGVGTRPGGAAALSGGGAAGLGGALSVNLSQGLARFFNGTSSANQQGCVVCLNPVYPAQAALLGRTGKVRLNVNGDAQGNVTQLQTTNSSYGELERAAIEAVKNWQLKPVTGGYHNYTVEIDFTKDGTAISVKKPTSAAAQPDQGSSSAAQLSPPIQRQRYPNEPTRVHDLAPAAGSQSTVGSSTTGARSGLSDRPSAPAAEPVQSTSAPQPEPESAPPSPEDNSTPSVSNLESTISPASDSKASATP
ncbi:TonB family protein [Kovacikia minuta CCNUW1]|uniref:energy transducer TonB n=1 Tax=Kovacikia minuta TaxID=2931930 RepID=UPI001CCFC963|nr:energy transducer TonB [Kovacikia minuta]UBF23555.1 TonB family protein [Kovacikia minuta CCNUW1]